MKEERREAAADRIFGLKRKAEDIWYYYKPHILIGIFVIIMAVLLIMQFAKPSPDVNIAYVGPENLNEMYDGEGRNIYLELQNDLKTILGGEANVGLKSFEYLAPKQLAERKDGSYIIDLQRYQTIEKQLEGEIVWGDSIIYFMHIEAFEEFAKSGDIFLPLDEILGEDFHDRYEFIEGEYVIKVTSLPYYGDGAVAGISNLSSDTVIAVRAVSEDDLKKEKNKKRFDRNADLLRKIVDYAVPPPTEEP